MDEEFNQSRGRGTGVVPAVVRTTGPCTGFWSDINLYCDETDEACNHNNAAPDLSRRNALITALHASEGTFPRINNTVHITNPSLSNPRLHDHALALSQPLNR